MSFIAPEVNRKQAAITAELCHDRGIIVPTFAQQRDPSLIPADIRERLKGIGLWDLHPLNLFRITWKNDLATGGFGEVNCIEIPPSLSGVRARIIGLVGKFFPTGAHKVGATFGCLVPRLVTGGFDPVGQKAVWPSTGNYCRGGAFDAALLGCESVAILPEEMSQERFEWLKGIGSEVIATPGCESNVKEIYDKCHELQSQRGDQVVVLNQFDEFGNGMWHYDVTGAAILEVFADAAGSADRLAGFVSSTGSAGTIAAGDRLKEEHPEARVIAGEALQCPTLLMNGFGGHRIEGIGDKHVPWIHNVRNTDVVVAVDDADAMALMRLFNEDAGREFLRGRGVPSNLVDKLDLLGISGMGNLAAAIKAAQWFELNENDILFTVFTDSMELYGSRLEAARREMGPYTPTNAEVDFNVHLRGLKTDSMLELDHWSRRRIHNLKYYTWVEQQGKDVEELNEQWYGFRSYWPARWRMSDTYDRLIDSFNAMSGASGVQ
ncbi:MAG: pyridoxal-phosphate dependent enzyme [Deltaproteobacteria bacterium]|nr:pyridoxal-phosphate dependent enzyme [Deltaproteobacteria bacterium]